MEIPIVIGFLRRLHTEKKWLVNFLSLKMVAQPFELTIRALGKEFVSLAYVRLRRTPFVAPWVQ